jgi:CheY-like chemotaxis protein
MSVAAILSDKRNSISTRKGRRKMSLLIVDNEPEMLELLCTYFRHAGIGAVCVSSCSEGLEALKRDPHLKAAILDLGMSPIDGVTCGGHMKTLYPQIHLYAFTAYSEEVHSDSTLRDAGFEKCYRKSVDDLRMVEEVTAWLLDGKTGEGLSHSV